METNHCSDCQHFIQHYGFFEGAFRKVYCGHCIQPKLRSRKPDSNICQLYLPKAADGDVPVKKYYLTEKLLNYVLSLEIYSDPTDVK